MSNMARESRDCHWIGLMLGIINFSNGMHLAILHKSYDSRFTSAGNKYYIISIGVFQGDYTDHISAFDIKECARLER